jgi:hypothetical protein
MSRIVSGSSARGRSPWDGEGDVAARQVVWLHGWAEAPGLLRAHQLNVGFVALAWHAVDDARRHDARNHLAEEALASIGGPPNQVDVLEIRLALLVSALRLVVLLPRLVGVDALRAAHLPRRRRHAAVVWHASLKALQVVGSPLQPRLVHRGIHAREHRGAVRGHAGRWQRRLRKYEWCQHVEHEGAHGRHLQARGCRQARGRGGSTRSGRAANEAQ